MMDVTNVFALFFPSFQMNCFLTFLLIASALSTATNQTCTELPSGTYMTSIGYNKRLAISTMDAGKIFIGAVLIEDKEDPFDEEEIAEWNVYERMLNSVVEYEMGPDCKLKITDPDSRYAWYQMFAVISYSIGQYAGIEGLVGKYDPESDSLILGGWMELSKQKQEASN